MMLPLRAVLLSPLATVALAASVLEPRALAEMVTFACLAVFAVFGAGVVAGTPVVLVLAVGALCFDRRAA